MMELKEKGQGFLRGALVLTAGMAAVKVIGALFKIPLKYAVGEYGMGLFNVAYNFYGPVFSLATAGFPLAVSRVVSENASLGRWNDVRRVKKAAVPLFLCLGIAGTALLTLFAPLYCRRVVENEYALLPMLALAPAVLFACVGSVYRGYYAGMGNMVPTALSEVLEAAVKLGLGLFAAGYAVSRGTEEYAAKGTVFGIVPGSPDEAVFLTLAFAAGGAILGVTIGSALSLAFLWLRDRIGGDGITPGMLRASPKANGGKETISRILSITGPVALGSVAMNAGGLIDATFLQNRLGDSMAREPQRFLSMYSGRIPWVYLENPNSIPTFLYGCYTLALTVYLLVPSVTQALGVSALPSVTQAWAKGDKRILRERVDSVARVTALFCVPAGLGLSALAEPVTRVLYGAGEASSITGGALALLGLASIVTAMSTPLSNMLQAVGRADLPVKLLLVAMGIKIGANWVLCGIPELNILGAAVGTLLCYLFFTLSQLWWLRRITGARLWIGGLFFRPFLSGCACAGTAWAMFRVLSPYFGEVLPLAFSILCGALIYVLGLLLLGGIGKNDLSMLPKGQKIAKMLEKRNWI